MTADTRHPNGLRGLLALMALSAATVVACLYWLAMWHPAAALVGMAVLILAPIAIVLASDGGDES